MPTALLSLQILPRVTDPSALDRARLPTNETASPEDLDLYRVVDAVIALIARSGLRHEVGAFETTIEGPLPRLLELVGASHALCHELGCGRVMSVVKIDTAAQRDVGFEEKTAKYR